MEFSARDGGWLVYRWGGFQRLMDVICGRAAVDTQTAHVSKQQGSFGLVPDCESQDFQETLNKWGAGWNLVGHLLMLSDTFENPRPQTVGDVRAAICSGLYSLWNPAFLHLFFLFCHFWKGEDRFPPCFLFFCQMFFPRWACRRQCQVGRPESLAQEASLTQNFTIIQAFSPSPLNRVFGKNHFVPPPSQWCSEAETSCRIPAGAQPGYGRVNWVIHAQQRMCFLAGLESSEHAGGACLGLMKWLGWSRGQKWFQVPLRNMEAVIGESLWEGGHCSVLVQHLTSQALDLQPITWAPWDCFGAESGKPNCSPLGMQQKTSYVFDPDTKAAIYINVSLSWSLLTAPF